MAATSSPYPAAGWATAGSTRNLTAARLGFGMNLKGCGWAAAGDRDRYCDTRSQVCTTERQERMIQS
jgi:hypothetical protein